MSATLMLPSVQAIDAELARRSLKAFIQQAWHVVEPSTRFVSGWHLDAIADHLEAVTSGQVRNLLINMPPRHMKSLAVSVFWPTWVWATFPEKRWLFSSYAASLSIGHSLKCRRLIDSPWYQANWGHVFQLTSDQNVKARYDNNRTGYRIATSVGGATTGEGGDVLVCLSYNSLIRTSCGLLPIGQIVEQRMPVQVLAFDHERGEATWEQIEAYESSPGRSAVCVAFATGVPLECTEDHPVFVSGQGYIPASWLRPGDEVLTGDVHLLEVRRSVRSAPRSRGEGEDRSVLLTRMLRESRARQSEFAMAGRESRAHLSDLPSAVFSEAGSGKARRDVLFDGLPERRLSSESSHTAADSNGAMRSLRSGYPSNTGHDQANQLLLASMCERAPLATDDGRGQWTVSARQRVEALRESVPVDRTINPRTGRTLSLVCQDAGDEREGLGRSPHRLRQGERCRVESDLPVSAVPSSDSRSIFAGTPRVGRSVVIDVKRIPTPAKVFNIRVANQHNYFASGVLVHNCDDPHNVNDASSDTIRESTLAWWAEVMSTRLNDPKTGARVIVMQRVHERDLSGYVLEQGGYEHLMLPAEFDGRTRVTSIGWSDPRTQPGELLWPARFGPGEIADLKREMASSYVIAGQLQQQPAPATGGLFQPQWFQVVDAAPAHAERCRGWDKAGTAGDGDYTAGVRLAKADGVFYVEDAVRAQLSSGQRNLLIKQIAQTDGVLVRIRIEQEPGSGGKESAEISVRELAGYDVQAKPSTGDKVTRARAFAAQAEAGNVRLVRGAWNRAFLDELALFPNGAHDDQVDSACNAFNTLALGSQHVDTSVLRMGRGRTTPRDY